MNDIISSVCVSSLRFTHECTHNHEYRASRSAIIITRSTSTLSLDAGAAAHRRTSWYCNGSCKHLHEVGKMEKKVVDKKAKRLPAVKNEETRGEGPIWKSLKPRRRKMIPPRKTLGLYFSTPLSLHRRWPSVGSCIASSTDIFLSYALYFTHCRIRSSRSFHYLMFDHAVSFSQFLVAWGTNITRKCFFFNLGLWNCSHFLLIFSLS